MAQGLSNHNVPTPMHVAPRKILPYTNEDEFWSSLRINELLELGGVCAGELYTQWALSFKVSLLWKQ